MSAITDTLDNLAREKRLRTIPRDPDEGLLDLSSNDYLGLGSRCGEFMEEFLDRFGDAPFSSCASRLLSARQRWHGEFEEYLSRLYSKSALLFNSGYHANVGAIGALALPGTLFLCDRLIHASIVDGLKMAGAEFRRFPHNDMGRLRLLLEKEAPHFRNIVIVAESIYSMDGDEAPLDELAEIKRSHPGVMIYLDEAHAFGVRGESGLGLAEEKHRLADIDLLIGTLGKAAASSGAFVACSEEMKSLLINRARPFIFSTAIPPANAAWSMLMTEKIVKMADSRASLSSLSAIFSSRIEEITGKPTGSSSQIIPLITGDSRKALFIAARLREEGYVALPIRRPTVPPGGERIRFSLGAGMDPGKFDPLFKTLEEISHEI